jgi:hypothetical protein
MYQSGRTKDRRYIDHGWAGWHTSRAPIYVRLWRRYSRMLSWLTTFGLLAFIGILLAVRG